jgi:tetratricopeptide (TPR) repeat protein
MTGTEARNYEADIDDAFDAGDLNRAEELADAYRRAAQAASHPEPARNPRWRAAYCSAQVALAAGRLRAALDLLLPLWEDAPRLPTELAVRLRLLLAEAHARLGQASAARALLDRLPASQIEPHPLLTVRWLRVRLALDGAPPLRDALANCDAALKQRGDASNRAVLACDEGRAWDRAGDLPRAAECWRRAERFTAASSGTDVIRADVLVQLGRLDHLRGHLGAALDRFGAACRCAGGGPHAVEATLRRALVRLELGRREEAAVEIAPLLDGLTGALPEELRPLADMARSLLIGTGAGASASDEACAYAAAQRGDTDAARSLYAAALATEPSPERRARLVLALGLLAAGRRDAVEARAWLSEAEALARSNNLPEVLVRVLQMTGQMAAEEESDDERARGLFEEAVLITEMQAGRLRNVADLQRALPAKTVYVAPALVADELYLLVVTRGSSANVLRGLGSAEALRQNLEGVRGCLTSQLARYRRGLPMGRAERSELDERLDVLGRGPLGTALAEALGSPSDRPQRVVWVPDGPLQGFPVHALRIKGRYLIEDFEFVWTFSGALLVHQAKTRKQRRGRFRPAVVVADKPTVLPEAEREGDGVAASFLWSRRLPTNVANRKSLRSWLARARVVHFACHAEFDGQRPLAARLNLPSGEAVHALEWLEEPVAGLPLVTLSACRSAEVAPLVGREVFGLVTGLLGGGVRAVLAGLWTVADREVPPLMWRFYRHRLLHELPTALALAQRETLGAPGGSPLFWAVFALFGDGEAIPAPGILGRFLARRRLRQHLRCFPV